MNSNATDVVPENPPDPNDTPALPSVFPDKADNRPQHAGWWLVAGALAAGLIAFAIGEKTYELIPPKNVPIKTMGQTVMGPSPETSRVAATWNGTLAFGALGICLGGCLGVAGALARRSVAAGVKAGLLGAVLAMILAVATSLPLLPYFLAASPEPDYELILSMVMHGTIWGLIGASAGLAFAVGLGERGLIGPALLAGLVGAAIGAIVFDMTGGILFPMARTSDPVSTTWPSRFLARLLVTVGTGAAIILVLPGRQPAKSLAEL